MTPETIFSICNYAVIPAWLLLALAPGWSFTQRIVHAVWIPLLFGLVYGAAIVSADLPEGGGFGSLPGVMLFFTVPEATLAGWVHYLVFDLFVGAWEVRDARRREIHHLLVVPCLAGTFLLGPLGLLAYLAIRFGLRLETGLVEEASERVKMKRPGAHQGRRGAPSEPYPPLAWLGSCPYVSAGGTGA